MGAGRNRQIMGWSLICFGLSSHEHAEHSPLLTHSGVWQRRAVKNVEVSTEASPVHLSGLGNSGLYCILLLKEYYFAALRQKSKTLTSAGK